METFDHSSGDYFVTGGKKIYYEFQGNRQGPVILFLHGGLGSMEDFRSLTPALAGQYCLLGMDTPGHGRSTIGSSVLTYALIQRTAEDLLIHLGISEVVLLGLSDGGIAAYRIAFAGNVTVNKLVTTGSRWQLKDAENSAALFKKTTAQSWKEKFPQTVALYERYNPEPDFEKLFKIVVAMWLDNGAGGYPGEALKALSMPVLITRGDTDHLTGRASVAHLADLVEKASLFNLPFAGHVAFDDQPLLFQEILKKFLEADEKNVF